MGLTPIVTYATGDTIEASWANTLRDNDGVLDGRTGGDPAAASKWLVSSSSTAGGWVARLTALADAFASGSVGSGLTLTGALGAASATLSGALAAASAAITNNATVGGTLTVTGTSTMNSHLNMGSGDQVRFATENGTKLDLASNGEYTAEVASGRLILQSNRHFSFHNAAASPGDYTFTIDSQTHAAIFQGAVSAASATLSGALTAASASISGAITSVTNLTMSGALSAASASIAGAITSVTNLTMSGTLTAAAATLSGALSSASAAISANATVGGTLGVTGTLTGTTINGTTAVQKNGTSVLDRSIHTGTQVASTISDFSTEVATILGGGGYARISSGTYSGDGAASKSITGLPFNPLFVVVQRIVGGNTMGFLAGHDALVLISGGFPGAFTGMGFSGTSFTVTAASGMNASGTNNYRYVAFG